MSFDASSALKKHGKILKAAYFKPPTESVPSMSLEVTSTVISTINQYNHSPGE